LCPAQHPSVRKHEWRYPDQRAVTRGEQDARLRPAAVDAVPAFVPFEGLEYRARLSTTYEIVPRLSERLEPSEVANDLDAQVAVT
jgi:hypothetical protein